MLQSWLRLAILVQICLTAVVVAVLAFNRPSQPQRVPPTPPAVPSTPVEPSEPAPAVQPGKLAAPEVEPEPVPAPLPESTRDIGNADQAQRAELDSLRTEAGQAPEPEPRSHSPPDSPVAGSAAAESADLPPAPAPQTPRPVVELPAPEPAFGGSAIT